jgi:hypothetical protein
VQSRRWFDLAQHGADVNRLAMIAAVIFSELLHAENFTQSREDAKKILQPISSLQIASRRRCRWPR